MASLKPQTTEIRNNSSSPQFQENEPAVKVSHANRVFGFILAVIDILATLLVVYAVGYVLVFGTVDFVQNVISRIPYIGLWEAIVESIWAFIAQMVFVVFAVGYFVVRTGGHIKSRK